MNNAVNYPREMALTMAGESVQEGPVAVEARDNPAVREYLAILLRRRWVILGIILLALLAGLAVTMLATPQYTAASRIEISRQQQRITNVEGVDQTDRTYDQEFYETQYELLKARSVAERVVRNLRLAGNLDFFAAHGLDPENTPILASWSGAPTRQEQDQRQEAAIGLLLGNVAIAPVARSSIVDITYTSASPAISAMIANEWARQFIQDTTDRKFDSTSDARAFLERRLSELRQQVENSERRLVTFANANDIVILDRVQQDGRTVSSPTLASTNLQQMNEALIEATTQRVALEAQAGATSSTLASNPAVANLRNRRAELAGRYAEMMAQFEPAYPPAIALRDQIAEIDRAIGREETRLRGGTQGDFQAALNRERVLRQRVNDMTGKLRTQETARIQYNIYQNEVDTNRALYEGVLQRYREIGVAGVGASNIALVDQAQVPTAPSSPNLVLNLLAALLAGVALAGVAVFIIEQFDDGVRDPAEVTPVTGLPMLGAIPITSDEDEASDLVRDAKSEISEAYFTVHSNLAFTSTHGFPKSLMVTSSRPAEGKSTTSFAIAAVLARTGKKVIIVDADMRSPSVHHFFGAPNSDGLSSFLAGDDNLQRLIAPTNVPNLSLLTAGRTPPSAAELLSADRMGSLIQLLFKQFDHVIVDSPPLLGLADAPLLSRVVEGVVYVVEASGVSSKGIKMSINRLRESKANLIGAILTKFSGTDTTGYGYGYGLKYGQSEDKS